jgi:hypothetical protein
VKRQRHVVLLFATIILFATSVAAENLTDLIALADKLNEHCRGLPGDTPHLDDICEAVTWLSRRLQTRLQAGLQSVNIPGTCCRCHGPLMEIDRFGERLLGCIECNRPMMILRRLKRANEAGGSETNKGRLSARAQYVPFWS